MGEDIFSSVLIDKIKEKYCRKKSDDFILK